MADRAAGPEIQRLIQLLARLPGRSRHIGLFVDDMLASGRVRDFNGRYEHWPVSPMNDTLEAGAELRRRLGY